MYYVFVGFDSYSFLIDFYSGLIIIVVNLDYELKLIYEFDVWVFDVGILM